MYFFKFLSVILYIQILIGENMTNSNKIKLITLFLFLASATLTAQRHPEPPKPHPRPQPEKHYSNQRHPKLETIEGIIRVHHREIYIETKWDTYRLIIDDHNPRLMYDRRDFIKLDGKMVELDGYRDNFFKKFEVVKIVRVMHHREPPRPQKRPEPKPRPEPQPHPRPQPKPQPRPRPQR